MVITQRFMSSIIKSGIEKKAGIKIIYNQEFLMILKKTQKFGFHKDEREFDLGLFLILIFFSSIKKSVLVLVCLARLIFSTN